MGKAYVPIYLDWLYTTQDLTPEEKGNLVDALVAYASGLEYEYLLTGGCRIAFRFLKAQLDRNAAISEARSAAGSTRKEAPCREAAPRETVFCGESVEAETSETAPGDNKNEQTKTNENKAKQNETKNTIKKEINKKKEKEEKENFVKEREQKREKKQKERTEESFARFWSAYPRHEAKAEARKAFEKLDPDESLLSEMLETIRRWKDTAQWKEGGGRFVPYPSTWLNQRRWEDEVPPAAPAYSPSGSYGSYGANSPWGPKPVIAQMYSQRSYGDEDAEAMRRMMLLPDTDDEEDEKPAVKLSAAM